MRTKTVAARSQAASFSRHPVYPGGSAAFYATRVAFLPGLSTSAQAVKPPGRARWRLNRSPGAKNDFARGIAAVTLLVVVAMATAVNADEANRAAVRDSATIDLSESADAQRVTHVKYSLQITGKLTTPSAAGTTDWDFNSVAKFEFDQRRFPSEAAGPFALRAVRRFQDAETTATVGKDHKTSIMLPQQSRLIHVHGGDLRLIQLSPEVRLTRPQLDLLQFPCDPLTATGLLPARNLKDKSEKWNADFWVVPMLIGIDASVSQSATCSLKTLTESEAVVQFDCKGVGAITGSATEIELKGELVFDRAKRMTRSLRATLAEKREPGTVSPGLNVTAKIAWTQDIAEVASLLPESMAESIPDERRLLLTLVTPWRVLLLHNRDWHIFHETSEMVMLRMLRDGALVAQCNLASAPLMSAGKFTEESEYLAEVEQAVAGRGGRIMSSRIIPDQNGWRIHHIQAAGEANSKVLLWDYYLCTAKSGEQISLVFSHAEEDEKVFSGAAEQMLSSLTIRSTRPKMALPR